jgi:hypothetical protein
MYPELNPYRPGSGLQPPAFVGRDSEIDSMDLIRARALKGAISRPMVLHGLRGVGKTVLLNKFRSIADDAAWLTVDLEATRTAAGGTAARNRLARGLQAGARKLSRLSGAQAELRTALGTISSFSLRLGLVSASFETAATSGRADSGDLEVDLGELIEDLAPVLRKRSTAFGLFVDEMQDLDEDLLSAVLAAQHKAGQADIPFYVFGAGLPSLPAVLSEARSYAERLFDYRSVGSLDHVSATAALVEPARDRGMAFDAEAAEAIVAASKGYPYFIQTFGDKVWTNAGGKRITLADATAGIQDGWAALDAGFYPARWDRATATERGYLRAMAADDDVPSRTAAIAERLGLSFAGTSRARDSLIAKGVIFAPDRGVVAFTVPGMSSYINREHSDN